MLRGRDPQRHSVQPGRHRTPTTDRPRPDGQDQERGLEGVLDLVAIAEHGAADAEHHRPVSGQQGGEGKLGRLVVVAERAANRSRSSTSLRAAGVPVWNRADRYLGTALDCPAITARVPRENQPGVSLLFSSVTRDGRQSDFLGSVGFRVVEEAGRLSVAPGAGSGDPRPARRSSTFPCGASSPGRGCVLNGHPGDFLEGWSPRFRGIFVRRQGHSSNARGPSSVRRWARPAR